MSARDWFFLGVMTGILGHAAVSIVVAYFKDDV